MLEKSLSKLVKTAIVCAVTSAITMGLFGSQAFAQDYGSHSFKVIGNWTNAPHFKNTEKPFWEDTLPGATGGALTAQITPLDELGLKGFDVGRMLKLGLFDFVHAGFTYVAGDNAMFEGVDLAGAIQNWDDARKSVDAYRPLLDKEINDTFDAKLLAIYSEPTQVFYCREPIGGIDDIAGKKVRVYNSALADMVEGMGGVPTSIDFAEVVPALQRGVVDCAVTGTLSGYTAKWYEVATHLFTLHAAQGCSLFLAVSNTTWNKLSPDAQKVVLAEAAKMEDGAWAFGQKADQEGIDCHTGNGPCSFGDPQKMVLVEPSDADLEKLKKIVENNVLAGWSKRCDADCITAWNGSAGKVLGLTAPTK
jgi:TRAP-type C4-dicarboxylate transport system substrate-binding protein